MAAKKIIIPEQLFLVAWLPVEAFPINENEVSALGGRVVDKNLSEKGAIEVEHCLNVGAPDDGLYLAVAQ